MEIALQKWGNSQGIRLSKAILKDLGITSEKATFEVEVKDKELILKKEREHPGQSKEADWGEPVGKEIKW